MSEVTALTVAFAENHPDEIATFLAHRPAMEMLQFVAELPDAVAAAVVGRLAQGTAIIVLEAADQNQISRWMASAAPEDALNILLHIPETRRPDVLAAIRDRKLRRNLERLILYPDRTVGALANPSAPRLTDSTTVGEAIRLLRAGHSAEQEPVWIVDNHGRLRGLLDLGRLLNARSERTLLEDCLVPLIPLRAETSLPAANDAREWLTYSTLPVVDRDHHLLGALSRQRLLGKLTTAGQERGLADGLSVLAAGYFRFMAICIADLLPGGKRR